MVRQTVYNVRRTSNDIVNIVIKPL